MIETAKPFIKWAGGKYKLAPTIIEKAEKHINIDSFTTYMDPFVGGGGMFFAINNEFKFDNKIISDSNTKLIDAYKSVKYNMNELIVELDKIEYEFNMLDDLEIKKEYYLDLREQFNSEDIENDLIKQSAFLIALNKLGFNGLYRVNSKGKFNVPFGQKKSANLYSEDNLVAVNEILQTTKILNLDFRKTIDYVNNKTLVYIDSPYRPLPGTPSFTKYAKSDFNDEDQKDIAIYCDEIKGKKGSFIVSNSDPTQVDPEDLFFDDLYSDYIINRISARRAIGATADRRGKVSELVILG